jgi:hypothetical protein
MVDPIRFNSAQPVKPVQGQSTPKPNQANPAGPNFADTLAGVQNLRFFQSRTEKNASQGDQPFR